MIKLIEWLYLNSTGNLAFYDRLTQVYNRNWWEIKGKHLLEDLDGYLVITDLNNLKVVNDTNGHEAGDKLLYDFSQELIKTFPKDYICRLGGDEFVIFCAENPEEKLNMCSNLFDFAYGVCHKTQELSPSICTKIADERMYAMKNLDK